MGMEDIDDAQISFMVNDTKIYFDCSRIGQDY